VIPEKVIKPILKAKANDKAMYGSVCRDFLTQLERSQSEAGWGGDVGGEGGGNAGPPRSNRNLEYTSPEDFPFLVERIRRLLNRLEIRPSRRQRQTHRSRWIDMRRSVRRSFRFGGALFSLGFRRPRLRRPKIVVLCDVSISMVRHIRFTLPLLFGLSQTTKATRAFVCAGGLEEVTDLFRQGSDFHQVTDWMLEHTTQVGRGTNLGQAFQTLRSEFSETLSASTCLLVVSDAETVDPNFAIRELRHISGQVKKLVWLNTQPRQQWHENKIVPVLRQFVRMEECTTLAMAVKIIQSL